MAGSPKHQAKPLHAAELRSAKLVERKACQTQRSCTSQAPAFALPHAYQAMPSARDRHTFPKRVLDKRWLLALRIDCAGDTILPCWYLRRWRGSGVMLATFQEGADVDGSSRHPLIASLASRSLICCFQTLQGMAGYIVLGMSCGASKMFSGR